VEVSNATINPAEYRRRFVPKDVTSISMPPWLSTPETGGRFTTASVIFGIMNPRSWRSPSECARLAAALSKKLSMGNSERRLWHGHSTPKAPSAREQAQLSRASGRWPDHSGKKLGWVPNWGGRSPCRTATLGVIFALTQNRRWWGAKQGARPTRVSRHSPLLGQVSLLQNGSRLTTTLLGCRSPIYLCSHLQEVKK